MGHVSYTELRTNLLKYMEEVCDSRAPLHVTRQKGRSVVLLAEDEYEGMMETLHLLSSPANARALMKSIAEIEAGRVTEFDPSQ